LPCGQQAVAGAAGNWTLNFLMNLPETDLSLSSYPVTRCLDFQNQIVRGVWEVALASSF